MQHFYKQAKFFNKNVNDLSEQYQLYKYLSAILNSQLSLLDFFNV